MTLFAIALLFCCAFLVVVWRAALAARDRAIAQVAEESGYRMEADARMVKAELRVAELERALSEAQARVT